MLRSMYSGISGMKNFQTKLDVIGNNIANVNTYGFKKGRVVFKDLISQQIAGASAPGDTKGGVNAKQVGLGSQLASIDTIDTTGSTQTTGRTLDLAISGDGYFMVGSLKNDITTSNLASAADITTDISINYTRAGNFYLDKEGYLVNSDGLYVVGQAGTKTAGPPVKFTDALSTQAGLIQIPTEAKSFSIGADGTVSYLDDSNNLLVAGKIMLAKFPNSGGLEKVGQNLYRQTTNSGSLDTDTTANGIQLDELYDPGKKGAGEIVAGALEMSNVDLSEEFTEMIVAQRGFQANTKIITTSDEILQELVNLKR